MCKSSSVIYNDDLVMVMNERIVRCRVKMVVLPFECFYSSSTCAIWNESCNAARQTRRRTSSSLSMASAG